MKKSTYLLIPLALVFIFLTGCTEKDDFPVYRGPYLGQSPPGSKPQLFMPGLISTNYINHCIGFLKEGSVCVFSIWEKGTFYMYEKDGRWTKPEKVPWQNEQGTTDFTVSPDGNTIYFQSRRLTSPDDNERETNIWKVEWTGDGWTEPAPLPSPANTEEFSEAYPSAAPDGSVYYFTGSRPDSGIGDIYHSKFVDGKYLEAERLPAPINSYYYEVDPFVAPDGSYLLFGSDRPGGYGLMDLYISFRREDGSWTNPINTGPELNPFCIPTRMSVTPDGKYFFFPSRHETDVPKGEDFISANIEKWGDYDIYWVDTSFINDLRDQYMEKKSAAEMIALEYREQGILPAAAMLSELYNTKQDSLYFELSEFMIFCGDLMRAGHTEEASQLYAALLQTIPEEFRIKQGYAITCILNGLTSQGLDLIKEMWAQFPSEKSEDMYLITFQLRRESRMEEELAVLRFITNEFPDSGLAHYWLAEAHEHYGNIEEAIKSCTKALGLKPTFEDAVEMRKRLEEDSPLLKGPYLGQKPPGMTPEIFAPGIISTGEHDSVYTFLRGGKYCIFSRGSSSEENPIYHTYITEMKHGVWTKPVLTQFNKVKSDDTISLLPDKNTILFSSPQSSKGLGKSDKGHNIWIVKLTNTGLSNPRMFYPPVNSDHNDIFPSITNDGTIYFFSNRDDTFTNEDIYRSKLVNGKYTEVERLGSPVNTENDEIDPFIAHDESYLIYCSNTLEGFGGYDLYITFRTPNGSWTEPINMGEGINSSGYDWIPFVTPDDKYFFFNSDRSGNADVYWVDAKIIDDFKKEAKSD